jgi:hypothetical protein
MHKKRTREMGTVMRKRLLVCLIALSALMFAGCKISTPEIRGIVLDAETKKPVEGAWVKVLLQSTTRTVAGDTHGGISLAELHLRTGKDGRFVIPSRKIKKAPTPYGFGISIDSCAIGVSTIDDMEGNINFRDEEKLKEFLKKKTIEVTIYVKPVEQTEREYFYRLQNLRRYFTTGRGSFEKPLDREGGDEWELDFIITKHERYLETHPYIDEIRSHHSIVYEQLGLLNKQLGNYDKAIEYLKKAKEIRFFRPQDIGAEIVNGEKKIREYVR